MAVLALVPRSVADEIDVEGVSYQRIQIVGLDGAQLAYRSPDGSLNLVSISRISRLKVDSITGLDQLNRAEDLVVRGQPERALTYYEHALAGAGDFWQNLIEVRLIQAADQADRIDLLVRHYIRILSDDRNGPALASELLPTKAPTSENQRVDQALAGIEKVIDDVPSQSARVLLELLRFTISDRVDRPETGGFAAELARQPIPPIAASFAAYSTKARAMMRWGQSGHLDDAIAEINLNIRTAPREVLPELLLGKAKLLANGATDRDSLLQAGWAAMRVVVHFPNDVLTPEALMVAARVHEELDRVPAAIRLLEEVAGHKKADDALRRRAESEIARLRRAS